MEIYFHFRLLSDSIGDMSIVIGDPENIGFDFWISQITHFNA